MVYRDIELIYTVQFDKIEPSQILRILGQFRIESCIYSDTRGIDTKKFKSFFPDEITLFELNSEIELPIIIDYETPNTLGKDRIAAAVGAAFINPGKQSIIIDIGTALTIDFIDEKSIFRGGIISPGPDLRYKALHHFTGKLPLVTITESWNLKGNSTILAIESGVQNGILFEINGYILRYTEQYPDIKVFLTGGYAYLFEKKINYPIFAESYLVPMGLNRILLYNEKKSN